MKSDLGKTYLLYARVSPKGSTWAAEETSIAVQLQECRAYVLQRDPEAAFIEVFDELKSGKNLNRPGVERVINDLRAGSRAWDCLVVWHLDRLTRSQSDALPLIKLIRDAGKGFISVRQNIDLFSAGGRFMLHIFISTAEYEREMTSERVTAKMHAIAANGKVPYGNVALGYRRKTGVKNTVEIDPETAPIVQEIFNVYLSGQYSFSELQKKYAAHIKYRTQIYKMLRNRFYIGEIEYGGKVYCGEHEPLIDREMFERVQKQLPDQTAQHQTRIGSQKYKYLLAGMVHCHCGNIMTPYSAVSRGKRFVYYKCTNPACKNAVSATKQDTEILVRIKYALQDRTALKKAYAEGLQQIEEERHALDPKIAELNRQIEDAKKAEDQIADCFTTGIVTSDNMAYWNGRLSSARQYRESLEQRRESMIQSVPELPGDSFFDEILANLTHWSHSLEDAKDDYALARTLIDSIIADITCTEKGSFDVRMFMTNCIKWCAHGDSNPRPND